MPILDGGGTAAKARLRDMLRVKRPFSRSATGGWVATASALDVFRSQARRTASGARKFLSPLPYPPHPYP